MTDAPRDPVTDAGRLAPDPVPGETPADGPDGVVDGPGEVRAEGGDDLLDGTPQDLGAVADPAAAPGAPAAGEDPVAAAQRQADERLRDLQRLQAEYVNYKRRVERDRDLVKQNATYAALAPITEVLDNIDRAREAGELDGGFRSVAEQLERAVAAAGLEKYGAPGDAFDPTVHEALSHLGPDPEVEVTSVKVVAKAGYRIGERVVRAAQVLVVEPADG